MKRWLYLPGGASAAPTPDYLWIKGSNPNNGALPSDGDKITTVHDFSTEVQDPANGGGATRPEWHSADGGYFQFGVGGVLNCLNLSRDVVHIAKDIGAIFFVGTQTKNVAGEQYVDSGAGGTTDRFGLSSNSAAIEGNRSSTFISKANSGYNTTSYYLVTVIFNGASSELRVNAAQVATGTFSTAVNPPSLFFIGQSYTGTNFFRGKMKEIRVFSRNYGLTTGQRDSVEAEMMSIHGL